MCRLTCFSVINSTASPNAPKLSQLAAYAITACANARPCEVGYNLQKTGRYLILQYNFIKPSCKLFGSDGPYLRRSHPAISFSVMTHVEDAFLLRMFIKQYLIE